MAHSRFSIYLSVLCLIVQCLLAGSVFAVNLDEHSSEVELGGELVLVEDVESAWTIEEAVSALAEHTERRPTSQPPSLGFSTSAYWGVVTVENSFSSPRQWVAKMRFASLDRFDMYYRDTAGTWVRKSTGDTLPFAEREIKNHSLLLSFPLQPGATQTLYFRVKTSGSVQWPLSLLSMEEYQLQSRNEYFWSGLYYGMLLIIALYSFFIWISTKDRGYLYYVLFLLAAGLYSFSFQGFAYQYLWADNPFWANRSILALIGLSAASGTLFVRTFIDLSISSKRIDTLLQMTAMGALAYALLTLMLPYALLSRLMVVVVFITMIVITLATVVAVRKGFRSAYFFMTAWSILLVGIFIELIQRMGVNIPLPLSYHSIQFGSSASIILLSLGLGDRISSMIREYSSVQSDMLRANQLKIEALQKADDVKEEFIANVSHELRTPLTGIIGLSEIILERNAASLDESARDNLNMIRISGQRLANLVNDVIDFSAIKNGHLELNRKPVDLKNICILVTKMCRPLLGEKPIQLKESFPEEAVIVLGDEDRLQQILFNLVCNAIKFTQRGWIAVSIEIINNTARVSVEDTGIGISRDQQSRIFNRFYQIDSAATREEGGTGLGLSISQKLVELHGTEIILHSNPGEGSSFRFDLPLLSAKDRLALDKAPSQKTAVLSSDEKMHAILQSTPPIVERRARRQEPEAYAADNAVPVRSRGRILVVDDEFLNVRIVREHLSPGYEIESALNGHDALLMLEQNKPDLMILDLMMPIMSGFELCQRIRMKYRMDELPIVILTAKNRVEDLVKGLNMGANDYISKPFSKEELKVRVDKQFEMLRLLEIRQENQQLSWQLQRYEETERKLRARETRLAKMLDVNGDALISVDEGGTIVYVNRPAEDLLGIEAVQFQDSSLQLLIDSLAPECKGLVEVLGFPFRESVISTAETPAYFNFTFARAGAGARTREKEGEARFVQMRVCVLPLSLDQEFFLLMFERVQAAADQPLDETLLQGSVPELIDQINRNVERTQVLGEYLSRITPEDLQQHRHLFADLENVDRIILNMSGSLHSEGDDEQQYREALVKLMQDCHYYWQKVTGESIIELAEKSRIWSVSIDNGRLRTRSMNRYLSVDKLPSNPRWRQVARTAYFVLSKVSHDPEAKNALEKSVARLQDIVESKSLS